MATFNLTAQGIVNTSATAHLIKIFEFTAQGTADTSATASIYKAYPQYGYGITIYPAQGDEAAESLALTSINIVNGSKGSIALHIGVEGNTTTRYILDGGGNVDRNLELYINADNKPVLRYGTAVSTITVTGENNVPLNTPFWAIVCWDEYGIYASVNGELLSPSTIQNLLFGEYLYIGSDKNKENQLNGIIDDLTIYSVKLYEWQVTNIIGNNQPLPIDPFTTYKMWFENDLSFSSYITSNAISSYWEGKAFDAGYPTNLKKIKGIYLSDSPNLKDARLQVSLDYTEYQELTPTREEDLIREYANPTPDSWWRYIKPKILHSALNENFELRGLTLKYKIRVKQKAGERT